MRDVLLEYVMKITALTPLPSASTAYLRKALVLVKPKAGVQDGQITECLTKEEVLALTDATCWKMLEKGMSSIFVLPTSDLDVSDIISATKLKFFTVIVDGEFTDVSTLEVGNFAGVKAWVTDDRTKASAFAKETKSTAFFGLADNKSINLYSAFGQFLSGSQWKNQQYIEMEASDDVDTIGEAELLFEDKISFVLSSEEYGERLALFANNRQAIVAPYVFEEIQINLQSKALQYINLNQPAYTEKEASLLEDTLQGMLDEKYVNREIIEFAELSVTLENENFVATSRIEVAEPKALWRIDATLQQGSI